jgi:hypothetical protein
MPVPGLSSPRKPPTSPDLRDDADTVPSQPLDPISHTEQILQLPPPLRPGLDILVYPRVLDRSHHCQPATYMDIDPSRIQPEIILRPVVAAADE